MSIKESIVRLYKFSADITDCTCCVLCSVVGFVDRVFILLAALSQRSLMGPSAANIIESILSMLTRLLSPLNVDSHNQRPHSTRGSLSLFVICDASVSF